MFEYCVVVVLVYLCMGIVGCCELGEGESLCYSVEGGVEVLLGGCFDDLISWWCGLLVFDE